MDADAYGKPKLGNLKKRSHNQLDNGKRKRHNAYPSHDHSSGTPKDIKTLYRILCPVKKIGSVLGKGGEIVSALRDETCANIRVADAIPGAEERVVIIFNPSKQSGKDDDDRDPENDNFAENEFDDMRPHCPAQDALLKIHDRIAADEYLRGGVVHEKTDSDDTVTAHILVSSNQVGCLLGKGGTVIQKLRSDYTGASIHVLPSEHRPPCAMSTDELVQELKNIKSAVATRAATAGRPFWRHRRSIIRSIIRSTARRSNFNSNSSEQFPDSLSTARSTGLHRLTGRLTARRDLVKSDSFENKI